jgi:hypothetical protein
MLNKLRKGQVTIFGKSISVLAALLTLAVLSGVGLALLTTYITITGSATVAQSIVIDTSDSTSGCHLTWSGHSTDECTAETPSSATFDISVAAGETRAIGIKIKNQATVDAQFGLTSTSADPLYASDVAVTYWDNYDSVDETCIGNEIIDPGNIDITASASNWYCVKYVWKIESTSATYPIDITVVPS